ncbi:hypothetical protein [Chamaesiphon minutus]|nr:hypothetical protein [Chamaesiphon minutus]
MKIALPEAAIIIMVIITTLMATPCWQLAFGKSDEPPAAAPTID